MAIRWKALIRGLKINLSRRMRSERKGRRKKREIQNL